MRRLLHAAIDLPAVAVAFVASGYIARSVGIAVDPLAVVASALEEAIDHVRMANDALLRTYTERAVVANAPPPN